MSFLSCRNFHLGFTLAMALAFISPQEAHAYPDVSQGEMDSVPTQGNDLIASSLEGSIVVPVTPSIQQPIPSTIDESFPRLSLADILILEPNLDPENARPSYTYTAPQLTPEVAPQAPTQVTRQEGYKVMVATGNSAQEQKVRSLMPEAFRTVYNGRTMLQVGLFRDRANAEEIRRTLQRQGVSTILVQL